MESSFSSLKTERTARKTYRTRDQAKADVFDYIECFYNPKRRHLPRDDIHLRARLNPHRRASCPIEHPNRQLQQSTRHVVVTAAADHIARRLLNPLMNMNDASCPRMPRIKDLALLGPMGVASSRCTTPLDRTACSATCRQPSMPRSAFRECNGTGRCATSRAPPSPVAPPANRLK